MNMKRRRVSADDVGVYSHKRSRFTADAPFQEFSAPVGRSMQTYNHQEQRAPMQFKPGVLQSLIANFYDSTHVCMHCADNKQ